MASPRELTASEKREFEALGLGPGDAHKHQWIDVTPLGDEDQLFLCGCGKRISVPSYVSAKNPNHCDKYRVILEGVDVSDRCIEANAELSRVRLVCNHPGGETVVNGEDIQVEDFDGDVEIIPV